MKKIISVIMSITVLLSLTSCEKNESASSKTGDQFNNWTNVQMDDSLLFYGDGKYANVLDYETMEASLLCNIPNCTHMTSQCLVSALKSRQQLPVIYNNCAYYFVNFFQFADGEDGKRILELSTTIMKYDFNEMELSRVMKIEGYNANCDGGGSYLTGSDYYFTTNNGDPDYDEAGNATGCSNSGQGKLYCINLETEELTDYGEIFDYEAYKKMYPTETMSTYFEGRNGDTLYFKVHFASLSKCESETYTFDMKTHEITKIADKWILCSGEGYVVYMKINDGYGPYSLEDYTTFEIENVKTGEVIDGPEVIYHNAVTLKNNKVWYDGKCYDIATGKEVTVTALECGRVIGIYDDNYIISGYDEGKVAFEKIPCDEIDKLFE